DLTLEGLKKRLDSESTLLVQTETGYSEPAQFIFFPSTSEEEIITFQNKLGISFPVDYKEFLLRHNGANLFVHPNYGGGFELFSLNMIRKVYIDYDYKNLLPDGWFPIGSDNGDMLFINSNQY